jgi:hypothetical protein
VDYINHCDLDVSAIDSFPLAEEAHMNEE